MGQGGMTSKIQAAEILQKNNIELWIVNGLVDDFLLLSKYSKIYLTKLI